MKKINRKGFTLIELLAVLVILVVIMAIAIPSVTSSIERSRDKEKNMKIKLIESEAELYIDRYSSTATTITVPTLITDPKSTLKAGDIADPNNSKRTLCGTVTCQNKTCTFTENKNISTSNESDYCVGIAS